MGGNAYDHHDDAGILVHKYGPRIFHTASREVFEYQSSALAQPGWWRRPSRVLFPVAAVRPP